MGGRSLERSEHRFDWCGTMVSCTLWVRRIQKSCSIEEWRARRMTGGEIGRASPELAEPNLSGEYCDMGGKKLGG